MICFFDKQLYDTINANETTSGVIIIEEILDEMDSFQSLAQEKFTKRKKKRFLHIAVILPDRFAPAYSHWAHLIQ